MEMLFTDESQLTPSREQLLPKRQCARRLMLDAMFTKLSTDMELPNRTVLRIESELPIAHACNIESVSPALQSPNKLKALPMRVCVRSDRLLPMQPKAITEMCSPRA